MAAKNQNIKIARRERGEIPERFTTAVLAWAKLSSCGMTAEVSERLRLERKDGCSGPVLFGMLVLMHLSNLCGQRALQEAASGCEEALATAIGARNWYSQSSMSRALASVTAEQSQSFCDWLLDEALAVGRLDRDDSTFHRDTFGESWRITDTDGRVVGVRQRALPEDEDLPVAKRLAASIAKPGYPGRKRGEVQFHRMVIQDSGTGRYLGVRLAPGGGDHCAEMRFAAARTAQLSDSLGFPRARTALRFDGKAAGAPSPLVCIAEGIGFVTRWTDYALLEELAVQAMLARVQWQPVPDSLSGPQRQAVELGTRNLRPFLDGAIESDEGAKPLPARIVVSRYSLNGATKRGCGKEIDGYVYEMYATSLPPDAWPAGELCGLYYGRTEQENDFGRLDKMLHFNHILTWHAPGQALATAVALFCWNVRLLWGAQLAGWHPSPLPPQPPREAPTSEPSALADPPQSAGDPGPEAFDVVAAASGDEAPTSKVTTSHAEDLLKTQECLSQDVSLSQAQPACSVPAREVDADDITSSPESGRHEAEPPAPPGLARRLWEDFVRIVVLAVLAVIESPVEPRRLAGWSWGHKARELRCPANHPMRLHSISPQSARTHEARFRIRSKIACRDCQLRASCTSSTNPRFRKEVTFTVKGLPADAVTPFPRIHYAPSPTAQPHVPPRYTIRGQPPAPPGPYATAAPPLLVSVLHSKVVETIAGWRAAIDIPPQTVTTRTPEWMSTSTAQRQHRRHTWEERCARSLIPAGAAPSLQIYVPNGRVRSARLDAVKLAKTIEKFDF